RLDPPELVVPSPELEDRRVVGAPLRGDLPLELPAGGVHTEALRELLPLLDYPVVLLRRARELRVPRPELGALPVVVDRDPKPSNLLLRAREVGGDPLLARQEPGVGRRDR